MNSKYPLDNCTKHGIFNLDDLNLALSLILSFSDKGKLFERIGRKTIEPKSTRVDMAVSYRRKLRLNDFDLYKDKILIF